MKARFTKMRRQKGLLHPEISLTPLIDTAWVLLVIFMVASPMIKKEGGLQVELPKGNMEEIKSSSGEDVTVSYVVSVKDKKSHIFLNDIEVEEKQLIEKLKKKIGTGSEKTVFVKADTAVEYGKVMALVDKIKFVGGVKYVALATSKL